MTKDKTLEEVIRIKEQCSLERLSRTPEEEKRHMAEVMKRTEARLGRKIVTVSSPNRQQEEVAQV